MDSRLTGDDWAAAFGELYEGGGICGGRSDRNRLKPTMGYAGPVDHVSREDLAEVVALSEGEHDERDWLCVGRVKDDLYVLVRAGCDYTGWDCQSGGDTEFAATLPDLIRWAMSQEERERLGLVLS